MRRKQLYNHFAQLKKKKIRTRVSSGAVQTSECDLPSCFHWGMAQLRKPRVKARISTLHEAQKSSVQNPVWIDILKYYFIPPPTLSFLLHLHDSGLPDKGALSQTALGCASGLSCVPVHGFLWAWRSQDRSHWTWGDKRFITVLPSCWLCLGQCSVGVIVGEWVLVSFWAGNQSLPHSESQSWWCLAEPLRSTLL